MYNHIKLTVMEDHEKNEVYKKAKKKVDEQKRFYYHLSVYIIINIALLFMKGDYIIFSENVDFEQREKIKEWFDRTLSVIPILWGIGLIIQGALIFIKSFFLNAEWEKQKIKKYLNKN